MKNLYSILVVLSSFFVWGECRAVSRECRDNFHNCETWRRSGLCHGTAHAFYLRNGCAKTCGFCQSDNPLQTNMHSIQDPSRKANKQKQKGVLGNQKLHAPPQAEGESGLSSRTCQRRVREGLGTRPSRTKCTDRFVSETCKEWKDAQICMDDRYRNYLTYGCALTCRFCNCRDTYREGPYCDEWKSRGFCEQYKDQLNTYCPKTCGFCVNAKYEETTVPSQNATAPTPSQNATAQPTQSQPAKPPSSDQEQTRPDITVVKNVIQRQPLKFTERGNTNSKRRLPLLSREGNSPLWSVNADPRITLPQPQQYDDMGGVVRRPLEDGTYFTPAKTNEKFEYYTEHYSPDPYVAAAQREEWMTANAGDGVAPNPSLSRKSKDPKMKEGKQNIKVVKKSEVKHDWRVHTKKH